MKYPYIASMGVYVIRTNVLLQLLKMKYPSCNDFGSEIIPSAVGEFNVQAYLFNDYWEDIGTIKSFFDANLALTEQAKGNAFCAGGDVTRALQFMLAELYEQAIKYEKGSFITSTGALATLSGAKTGRSPSDKRVVRDETTDQELWWGKGSPNIEMDEHTFLVNRERAVDYLNSLDKVFVNVQFLNWDPENKIKVRIVSAGAYHSLCMHNMCIRPTPSELEDFGTPDFTIYNAGQFPCNRYTHYMTSSTSIDLNLARREMVILMSWASYLHSVS